MNSVKITIGSRGSDLALWQAHFVRDELEKHGHQVEIKIIKTKGDAIQHLSFDKMEGKGFFTKEIESALLAKEIDLAVHSYKDLETTQPKGLKIGATSYRANPVDTILIRKSEVDQNEKWSVKKDGVIGTSSARRKLQIQVHRPDLQIKDIRGNVPTRIGKLRSGDFDAIVLAKAGIDRLELDLSDLHVFECDPLDFIPAPAQGVLALQIREDHSELEQALEPINNVEVANRVGIERKVLNLFHGGCQLPLGAYCVGSETDGYRIDAIMAPDLQSLPSRVTVTGDKKEGLAERVVAELKKKA